MGHLTQWDDPYFISIDELDSLSRMLQSSDDERSYTDAMNKHKPTPAPTPTPDALTFNIHLFHHNDPSLERILHTMSENIDAIRQDLEDVKADLSEIKDRVATALESIPALQATIAEQKAQIDALTAGDALTEQQLADLKLSADSARDQAESVAASLRPSEPPVEPTV